MSKILEALGQLDPSNDNHWTSDGLPRIDSVKFLSGEPGLTRDDISKAAPGFSRQNPLPKTDAQAAGEQASGTPTEPALPAAPAAPVPGVQLEQAQGGEENGQVQQEEEARLAPRELSGAPSLEEQLAVAQEFLADVERAKVSIIRTHAKATAEVDRLINACEKAGPQETTGDSIRHYLESQQRHLQRRAEQLERLRGIDLKELIPSKAPIDAALGGRKRVPQRLG